MKVVDASALAPALIDGGERGKRFRAALRASPLAAPALIDLEVASTYRRLVAAGEVTPQRATAALARLIELPLARSQHSRLIERVWELRGNVTSYDAAYIALAEALGATLVTADGRLSRAPGIRCAVTLVA